MRLNMQFVIGAFLTLTMISSCDTFRDEITPDSYSETIKHVDGNWRLFTVSRNGIDITAVSYTHLTLPTKLEV